VHLIGMHLAGVHLIGVFIRVAYPELARGIPSPKLLRADIAIRSCCPETIPTPSQYNTSISPLPPNISPSVTIFFSVLSSGCQSFAFFCASLS
jgi:hypothetical protein